MREQHAIDPRRKSGHGDTGRSSILVRMDQRRRTPRAKGTLEGDTLPISPRRMVLGNKLVLATRGRRVSQNRRHSKEASLACPVAIGLARLKRESWVLVGFEPINPDEHARLSAVRQELCFDPCTEPERLAARGRDDQRSAKRVLRVLTNGDPEREANCWRTVSLALLRTRGQATGLGEYLEDVRNQLVPLFTGYASD